MTFRVYQGKPTVVYKNRAGADTHALEVGSAVAMDSIVAGTITHLAGDSDDKIWGVAQKAGAAGDTIADVPVLMAEESVTWEVETDSDGGAAASDVGTFCAIDTEDTANMNATVDISDKAPAHFLITEVVSATRVRGRFGRTALRQPAGDALDS